MFLNRSSFHSSGLNVAKFFRGPMAKGIAGRMTASTLTTVVRCCSSNGNIPSEDEVRKAYTVLGLQPGPSVTLAEVKKRYIELAKQHHPDVASAGTSAGGQAPQNGNSASSASGSSSGASHATSQHENMVNINHAYNTVTRFTKAGRTLSQATSNKYTYQGRPSSSSSSSSPFGSGASYQYYNPNDPRYEPWHHEDVDPLFYEMMWEEMRRQNAEDEFNAQGGGPSSDDFYSQFNHFKNSNKNGAGFGSFDQAFAFDGFYNNPFKQDDRNKAKRNNNNNNTNKQSKNANKNKKKTTTTWPEADLKALVNMYQDGKSFEFIANALGKTVSEVTSEFNHWSDDNKNNNNNKWRNTNNNNKNRRNGNRNKSHKVYYSESPGEEIPFELYQMMYDEDGNLRGEFEFDDDEDEDFYGGDGEDDDPSNNIYGYQMPREFYDTFYDPYASPSSQAGSMPFNGTHYMHDGGYTRNNNANRHTPKYQKKGPSFTPTYNAKNFRNFNNNNKKKKKK